MPRTILNSSSTVNDAMVMFNPDFPVTSMSRSVVMRHISHVLGIAVEDLDIGASFINQGGHSLLAIELASLCRSSGIGLAVGPILLAQSLQEILDVVDVPSNTVPCVPIIESMGKESLSTTFTDPSQPIKLNRVETVTEVDPEDENEPDCVGREVTLTEIQLSFVHSFVNKMGTNVISFYETYKTDHLPSVRIAWQSVIKAEAIFKLSFAAADYGRTLELPEAPFTWSENAFESRAEYEAALERDVSPKNMEVSFDVFTLLSQGISTIVWRVHHAFIDGIAAQLVYDKFQGALAGKDVIAGTPFQNVILELREYRRKTLPGRKEFWNIQAVTHPQPVSDVKLGATPTPGQEGMDSVSITIPFRNIETKARTLGVSLPSWYQAAWALVLSLYSDSDSVAFGTVLSGRDLPINGAADTVGPLINTLPFNVMVDQGANVADYIRSIFRHSVKLSSVQCSVPDDGFTRHFTTALAMEFRMTPTNNQGIQPLSFSWFEVTPDIPLSIFMTYDGEIRLCFHKARYLRGDIQSFARHFQAAIMCLSSWTGTVGDIMNSIIAAASKDTLMAIGNCLSEQTSQASIKEDLVTLFEKSRNLADVMCHHAGLVAFQSTPEVRFYAGPGQRISQLMSPAFDGSIHEIFSALCYGATLVLAEEDGDPFAHLKRANAAIMTPSIAKVLDPSDYPDLKTVYCVGEQLPQYVNDTWSKDSSRQLYNMYGPTEGTCGATIQRLLPGRRVTIGKPNPSTRVYVLDRNQRLLPPGVVGEIYCAGVQVARGYISRPELTAERFLPDKIHRGKELMYRTGDRGFFNSNGELECLGRSDREIKLRGYRIDLDDLEVRMAGAVEGATAVAICQSGDYLVCVLQPETLNTASVRTKAISVLPAHAVPRCIVAVDRFPITTAGKIDYKEIARMSSQKFAAIKKPKQAPMSPSQLALERVWRETLELNADVNINADSNFIALGGHSVLQLQLSSKLAKIHHIDNVLPLIIHSATLGELAAAIDGRKSESHGSVTRHRLPPLGNNKVSPIEKDWFLKYNVRLKGTTSFNVSYACAINADRVDKERLVGAWNVVLRRHRIFRSRFVACPEAKGSIRRSVNRNAPRVTRIVNGRGFSLWREVNRPFRLDRDENLIRVLISKTEMLVVVSHILADLTTLQTMLNELTLVYNGEALVPVKRTYQQTVQWSQVITSEQEEWWKKNLEGAHRDYGIPHPLLLNRTSYAGKTRYAKLSPELSRRLIRYTEQNKTTLHQLALASVAMAMQLHRSNTDIVLGAPYLNREVEDLETVGLFLEPLPIRIKYREHSSAEYGAGSFIAVVREASQHAVSHAIPWHHIIKATGADRDSTRQYPNHPLLDIMVTFHDHRVTAESKCMRIEGLEPMITHTKGAKFLLLVEFSAVNDNLILLRMEFDNECIPRRDISMVERLIIEAMGAIMDGRGYSETKQMLRSIQFQSEIDGARTEEACALFGKGFNSLGG